ncbi:TlpA family protein disulfide reductase [Alteromonas oceanisediminis]|uniref:TlpA family protein disulfide reductase n=1 Tax=Alteromonas oceanisediminis TaxID=2836180 RepID=UPI001BD95639|nr:TlpA disulfide reductase family protein [Alteromonas oceanisediminis]MBT0586369.1 TlpA family protein disulfide reductase [Alteromonas oceanisediminis]
MRKVLFVMVAVSALVGGVLLQRAIDPQDVGYDFETLDGHAFRWQDFNGQYVVVNYFAEWCAPCLKEVPELNQFEQLAQQSDSISLFAVSYDPLTTDQLTQVKRQYNMQFALLNPAKTQAMPMDKPQYLPATYIIKPDGSVTKPLLGEQTAQSINAAILQLQQSF